MTDASNDTDDTDANHGGAPARNQNASRHGLYADPANVLDELAERDGPAYEWVMKKYDAYLDSAPFGDGSAKADQLKQLVVQEFIIWRAIGVQVEDGLVVETNEPDGTAYGDRLKEHPVNLPLDRMQRTVSNRLTNLAVLDDEADTEAAGSSKADAIRELMAGVDDTEDVDDEDE